MESLEKQYLRLSMDAAAFEKALHDDTAVHREDIPSDLAGQAGLYSKWAMFAEFAQNNYDKVDQNIELFIEPEAKEAARIILKASGEKETVERLKEEIRRNRNYAQMEQEKLRLKGLLGTFRAAEKSMAQRFGCLQSYNGRQRSELNGL